MTYIKARAIELLSPARDLQCGIESIRHGADAVYIGGPGYGARMAAPNSVEHIAALCQEAHTYGARVYVTINTIIYEDELQPVRQMAWQLHEAGADAFIVQDLAMAAMDDMPPVPLHASTQMDNRTASQVQWLLQHGFRQAVLARELTLGQIAAIHDAVPSMPLEAFVHGAVCVSYSGRCYASQRLMGRSANRGQCAQVCRLPFDLTDGDGRTLARSKHLLSLCDMNRSSHLEAMMDAGVSSFKIEGRLKDVSYVKNITAYYRRRIDEILERRPDDYVRSSLGLCTYTFTPQPEKSFNRGFTDYFLTGKPAEWNPDTPKMMGPVAGTVRQLRRDHVVVSSKVPMASGDGLCYLDDEGVLHGFRVNRAEGDSLFLRPMPRHLPARTVLHRNHDQAFDTMLQGITAQRCIPVTITFAKTSAGFALTCGEVRLEVEYPHAAAHVPQDDNIVKQLSRLGDTPYRATVLVQSGGDCFVPSSLLAQWRRQLVQMLDMRPRVHDLPGSALSATGLVPEAEAPQANCANSVAARFLECQVNAFELHPDASTPLMTCRHCVRRAMGLCGKPIKQPWHLVLSDGRRLRLDFDCRQCIMRVYED